MANTYSQIYVHFIISVKNRMPLIKPEWEQRLPLLMNIEISYPNSVMGIFIFSLLTTFLSITFTT